MLRYIIAILLLCIIHCPVTAAEKKVTIFQGDMEYQLSLSSIMHAGWGTPDFLELPLVLSRDNVPVIFDDIFLHPKTNVSVIFPDRMRPDGMYYLVDFSWDELQQLTLHSRIKGEIFPGHLVSYGDAAKIIRVASNTSNDKVRTLPVIKYPWFHTNEEKDISTVVLKTAIASTTDSGDIIYLKCFDPDELQRIHKKILPGLPVEVKLIQGIDLEGGRETMRKKNGEWISYNYSWLFTRLGARVLSGYAYGVYYITLAVAEGETLSQSIEDSHGLGMKVFTGLGSEQIAGSPDALFEEILFTMNLDGLALPSPKALQTFLNARTPQQGMTGQEGPPDDETAAETILSDPEALSRRLKHIQ